MPRLVNLGVMRSRKNRPAKEQLPPWQPGKSSRQILEYLHHYRYLTSELLGLIYEAEQGRGRYQVQHELTRLWQYGLAERFYRPTESGLGSSQYVYVASVEGARLVVERDEWSEERRKVYNRNQPKADYEHPLAVAVLQLLWELGDDSHTDLFQTISCWQDKEGTKKETRNHFEARVAGQKIAVQPDMTVLLAHQQRDYYRPYFFELERTHKNYERQRRRFQSYGYLLSKAGEAVVSKVFYDQLGIIPERGLAVFVADNAHQADLLRRLAVTVVPKGTELWFSSLEELLEPQTRLRRDGSARLDRRGQHMQVEMPIPPAEFFDRELLVNLEGKRGRLVV